MKSIFLLSTAIALAQSPGTFTPAGSTTAERLQHAATLLPDGRVLLTGGYGSQGEGMASAEIYDPSANAFTATASMSTPRRMHSSTLLPDGRILVVGGYSCAGPLATAEIYEYSYGLPIWRGDMRLYLRDAVQWLMLSGAALTCCNSMPAQTIGMFAATGSMTMPREGHTATLLFNGRVLLTGGFSIEFLASSATNSAELYDPATGSFTATGSMATARYGHTATRLPDGRVLIAGGYDTKGYSLNSAEIYDPATGMFTATGDMSISRAFHAAALLNNGKVLATGGTMLGYGVFARTAAAELYDPASGSFSLTGNMTTIRSSPKAALLANGQVLVAPGDDGADYGSADLYDSLAGTFSALAFTNSDGWLVAATANLLPTGSVLLTLQDAECDFSEALTSFYDPKTGMFSAGPNMPHGHCQSTAAQLSDGSVLIVGSIQDGVGPNPGADVYDPVAGTFSPAGAMITTHNNHRATLLESGDVLVTGDDTAIAELYHPPSAMAVPVLLTVGAGQAAVLHAATQQLVSASNPAVAGEALEIFCTGLLEGSAIPPQVAIGGQMTEVLFFGDAPGFAGLNQVNVRMPANASGGGAASVRLTYLDRPSNAVTLNVQ